MRNAALRLSINQSKSSETKSYTRAHKKPHPSTTTPTLAANPASRIDAGFGGHTCALPPSAAPRVDPNFTFTNLTDRARLVYPSTVCSLVLKKLFYYAKTASIYLDFGARGVHLPLPSYFSCRLPLATLTPTNPQPRWSSAPTYPNTRFIYNNRRRVGPLAKHEHTRSRIPAPPHPHRQQTLRRESTQALGATLAIYGPRLPLGLTQTSRSPT